MTSLFRALTLLASLISAFCGPASAADPSTLVTQGASIRLIADAPDAIGRIRGALLFELEPGWKTYWREPGEAGLAPSLMFRADGKVADANVFFPTPRHLDEGGMPFNGYDASIAIAFEIPHAKTGVLELDLFAGLCHTLCIPVSGRLTHDLTEPLSFVDRALIEGAFLSLPRDASLTTSGAVTASELVVHRVPDAAASAALFVSGPAGWRLGVARNGSTGWRVPVLDRPRTTEERSVSFDAVVSDESGGRRLTIETEALDPVMRGPSSNVKRDDP